MAAKCTVKTVTIRRKGSRTEIAKFRAHVGSGCAPRKKPSTAHLRPFKAHMKAVAPSCRKRFKPFTKPYGKCIRDGFRNFGG